MKRENIKKKWMLTGCIRNAYNDIRFYVTRALLLKGVTPFLYTKVYREVASGNFSVCQSKCKKDRSVFYE